MGDLRGINQDFETEYEYIQNKYQRKGPILKALLEREVELKAVVEELKNELVQANGGMGSKVEQINKLTRRLAVIKAKKAKGVATKAPLEKDSIYRLPDEVWRKILHHITESIDKENFTMACPHFWKIQLRTTLLFKEVFPHIVKFLGKKNKLKCRFICKVWNAGVDDFFDNSPSNRPHDDETCDPRNPPFISRLERLGFYPKYWKGNLFEPYAQWWWYMRAEFQRMDGNWDRNPLLGREMIIHSERSIAENVVDDLVDHIWYCTMFGKPDSEIAGLLITAGDRFRRRPPNLRKLRICGYSIYDESNKPAVLERALHTYEHLETLQIDEALRTRAGDTHPIIKALLKKYHLQLGRLHVRIENMETVSKLEWPSLTELHVTEIWSMAHCEILNQVNMPNLRKLAVSVNFVSLDELLGVLHKLSSTLSRLDTLRLCGATLWNESFGSVKGLYAPASLKTLEIEHSRLMNTMTWYNILLHFPLIENVNVFWRRNSKRYEGLITSPPIILRPKQEYYDKYDAGFWEQFEGEKGILEMARRVESEVTQVHKFVYEGGMYKSIIWEVLPRLKVFTFQLDLYTRAGYEKFRNSRRKI